MQRLRESCAPAPNWDRSTNASGKLPTSKPSSGCVSPEDSERFFSDLHPISLAMRHVVQAVADPFEYVYFIEQGVASVLTIMANGATVEVGMIGMEGLIGVSALLALQLHFG